MKIWKSHVLASIGDVQASPHPPKSSNSLEIHENQRDIFKSIEIHVLVSSGNVQASPHPPYFSKHLGTVPNAMYDGNQHAKKEIGGRGGAFKSAAPRQEVAGRAGQ